jgi:hypothetical protein
VDLRRQEGQVAAEAGVVRGRHRRLGVAHQARDPVGIVARVRAADLRRPRMLDGEERPRRGVRRGLALSGHGLGDRGVPLALLQLQVGARPGAIERLRPEARLRRPGGGSQKDDGEPEDRTTRGHALV